MCGGREGVRTLPTARPRWCKTKKKQKKLGVMKPKLALTPSTWICTELQSPRKDKEGVSLGERCMCVCVCVYVFWVKETTEKGKCFFLEQCSKWTHAGNVQRANGERPRCWSSAIRLLLRGGWKKMACLHTTDPTHTHTHTHYRQLTWSTSHHIKQYSSFYDPKHLTS